MSPKLRRLSGPEVVSLLARVGFETVGQRGSHVKLARSASDGTRQVLTIPIHKQLDTGTLRAIVRQASRFIDEPTLHALFYSE